MNTLLKIGNFKFYVPEVTFDTISQTLNFNWAKQPQLGRGEGLQYTGESNEEITISGVLFPQFSGRTATLEELRQMAASGKPQMLVDATGNIYGFYSITSISRTSSNHNVAGAYQKQTYEVKLLYYGSTIPN